MGTTQTTLTFAFWCIAAYTVVGGELFSWMAKDSFDEIMEKMSAVTAENCHLKQRNELELPREAVSDVPHLKVSLDKDFQPNRVMLAHMQTLALQRAFYYSFIYQRLNAPNDFQHQPGLMYLYMSTAADVSASPGWINGSSLLYDNNCTYPNWYTSVYFNATLPLFGPRSWRVNNFNEADDINVVDYATGSYYNYTDKNFNFNPYTRYASFTSQKLWWPDNDSMYDYARKSQYNFEIKFSNQTGEFLSKDYIKLSFMGPPTPKPSISPYLPVEITQPYFDCGRSNQWITTMTSPIVDYLPRYTAYTYLKNPRYVAIAGIDANFKQIDIMQCPIRYTGPGNMFAGTHRCRNTTTCEPITGYGFRRGGYQCVCIPGYIYPLSQDGPFQGWEIEQATQEEYENDFDCIKSTEMEGLPEAKSRTRRHTNYVDNKKDVFMNIANSAVRDISAYPKLRIIANRKRRLAEANVVNVETFEEENWNKMQDIRSKFFNITNETCYHSKADDLFLPSDANYGAEKQFESQGRSALRLAHFLSNFLQNIDDYEQFGELKGDRRFTETHIFGEVIAMVMADFRVLGAGVYFDQYKFRESPSVPTSDPLYSDAPTREYFGPNVRRRVTQADDMGSFRALDAAGLEKPYTEEQWFKGIKQHWASNTGALKEFSMNPMIRDGPYSTGSMKFEHYPITFKAPSYEDGVWGQPEFRCDEYIDNWVVTYSVPFFGLNDMKTQIEFKGIVTIDVKLSYLDINQCPGKSNQASAFKNTAKCDFESQYCVPVSGKGFQSLGDYTCNCRQGYVYPFGDRSRNFDGQMMEDEYEKKSSGESDIYDTLKCEKIKKFTAGASSVAVNVALLAFTSIILLLKN